MPEPTTCIPFEMMEAARLLVRHGRYWLDLTDDDIERGARAVALSPAYRAELARTGIVHANDQGDAVDAAICAESWDLLDRWAARNGSSNAPDNRAPSGDGNAEAIGSSEAQA